MEPSGPRDRAWAAGRDRQRRQAVLCQAELWLAKRARRCAAKGYGVHAARAEMLRRAGF